jgi:hypothetical protein
MKLERSATYYNLTDWFFKYSQMTQESSPYSSTIENGAFRRIKSDIKSNKIMQPIVMAENEFIKECSNQEWLVIRRIMCELKEYNCLWHCDPNIKGNSSNRVAINALIKKGIICKTETPNIYVVNPFYIRRGDLMTVICTTAKHLENASKVSLVHITNKKPVDEYIPNQNQNQNTQIGYGYNTDENTE